MLAARARVALARASVSVWPARTSLAAAQKTCVRALSSSARLLSQPPSLSGGLTEDELHFREAAARFAREQVAPLVKEMDENQQMDSSIKRGMFEHGFLSVEVPHEYGGAGASFTSGLLVIEELAKVDPSVSLMADLQNTLITQMILQLGSEEQRRRYLPRLCADTLGSFCLSEAGSGSDAFAMKTRAVRDGDHYVLNGEKCWISNAGEADIYLVMANANPEAGYKGITCFIVDSSLPGFSVGKKENKLGMRASATAPVILEDVRVPCSAVLGEEGQAYKYAIEHLNTGRIGIAAQMLGLAQGAFDVTLPYIHQRKQFGQSIAQFQGIKLQYARIATELRAARLMVYEAARRKEAGLPFVEDAAMAKLYASEVAEKVASCCINWLGGVGFTNDFPVAKFYRDCKVGAIYEGTSNMLLLTISKQVDAKYDNMKH